MISWNKIEGDVLLGDDGWMLIRFSPAQNDGTDFSILLKQEGDGKFRVESEGTEADCIAFVINSFPDDPLYARGVDE